MGYPPRLLDHLDLVAPIVAAQPFGLFCDLDGTISPIVGDPMAARVTESARRSLSTIRRLGAHVAIVTGRSVVIARAIARLRGVTYIGIHGLEWSERGRVRRVVGLDKAKRAVHRLNQLLAPLLVPLGITVEAKEVAIAFHLRRAPDPEAASLALEAALVGRPELGHLVRIDGRQVVELRAKSEETKGTAVSRLVEARHLRSAIYIGDDRTDVFAFKAVHQLRNGGAQGLAIAVVEAETASEVLAAADYVLAGVPEVERFLEWLARELDREARQPTALVL